jgi:hypothetical protein
MPAQFIHGDFVSILSPCYNYCCSLLLLLFAAVATTAAATLQFIFDYYVIIRKLFKASNAIYNTDVDSKYNFIWYTISDKHNLGILTAVWVGTLPILFVDTSIFYVIGANIFAVIGGLWRRVGEVRSIQLLLLALNAVMLVSYSWCVACVRKLIA